MTDHDFEKAHNELEDQIYTFIYDDLTVGYGCHRLSFDALQSIRFALRLASAVMKEPSEDVVNAGISSYDRSGKFAIVSHYKSMIKKLVEEVDQNEK